MRKPPLYRFLFRTRFGLLPAITLLLCVTASAQTEFTDGSATIRVVDANESPVAGAAIVFVADTQGPPNSALASIEQSTSGSDGLCKFGPLHPGNYFVRVTTINRGAWGVVPVFDDTKNASLTIKIGLYNSSSGRVVDTAGKPVSGAQILVRGRILAATTDAQGMFRIGFLQEVAAGSVNKPGFGWLPTGFPLNASPQDYVLQPGGTLNVSVVGVDGKPVSPASFSYGIRQQHYIQFDYPGKSQFKTIELPADESVELFAWHETKEHWFDARATTKVAAGTATPVTLQLNVSADIASETTPGAKKSYHIGLWYLPKNAEKETLVSGRVVMDGTTEGVPAGILYDQSHEWVDDERGHTKADGSFVLSVKPGTYFFTTFPDNPALYTVGGLTQITVPADRPVENLAFSIRKGCVIQGFVRTADGEPVESQEIGYVPLNQGHYRPFWTDKLGRFTLDHLPFPSVKYELTISNQTVPETVKVSVGPVGEGKTSEPIVMQYKQLYRTVSGSSKLAGTVVDEKGSPVSAAFVAFIAESADGPTMVLADKGLPGSYARTDDAGEFSIPFAKSGPVKILVARNGFRATEKEGRPTLRSTLDRDYEVVDGGSITLTAGHNEIQHKVVVRRFAEHKIAGIVVDDAGQPVNDVSYCLYTGEQTRGSGLSDGKFAFGDLFDGPVDVIFFKEGFQCDFIESGRQFTVGDKDIRIVMKKAPYPKDVSVWTLATGRPESKAEIAAVFRGAQIKSQLEMIARQSNFVMNARVAASAATPASSTFDVLVTDGAGKPVNRIHVQGLSPIGYHYGVDSLGEYAMASNMPSQLLDGRDGHYALARGSVAIWADGMSQALFSIPQGKPAPAVTHITLYPASTIIVQLIDYDGKPVSGIYICPASNPFPESENGGYGVPKTDDTGKVTFERVPPGSYSFIARMPLDSKGLRPDVQDFFPVVQVTVEAGKSYDKQAVFGTPKTGTPEALLAEWVAWARRQSDRAHIAPPPNGLHSEELARVVSQRMDSLPGQYAWEPRAAAELATVAKSAGLASTTKSLESLLRRWGKSTSEFSMVDPGASAMVDAFASLRGDDAVDLFATLAADTNHPYFLRREFVFALGNLGSKKSLDAYRKLRDAAYARAGTPPKKEPKSDAEAIAGAAMMAFIYIPLREEENNPAYKWRALINQAKVDADGQSGSIMIGGHSEGTLVNLKRINNEWYVVGIGGSWAS